MTKRISKGRIQPDSVSGNEELSDAVNAPEVTQKSSTNEASASVDPICLIIPSGITVGSSLPVPISTPITPEEFLTHWRETKDVQGFILANEFVDLIRVALSSESEFWPTVPIALLLIEEGRDERIPIDWWALRTMVPVFFSFDDEELLSIIRQLTKTGGLPAPMESDEADEQEPENSMIEEDLAE